MDMVEQIKSGAERNSGLLVGLLLILQAVILPMQAWTGLMIWDLRDRIAASQETMAILETRALSDHERYDRQIEDHESRIRSLERR